MKRTCCPTCQSKNFVKNGFIRHEQQSHRCKECGRQFVLEPITNQIPDYIKELINKLLLERLSLAGICRVTEVSHSFLMNYLTELYHQIPEDLNRVIPEEIEGVIFYHRAS